MSYIEFVLWKSLAFVMLAFLWGLFCGLTGRNLRGQRPDDLPD